MWHVCNTLLLELPGLQSECNAAQGPALQALHSVDFIDAARLHPCTVLHSDAIALVNTWHNAVGLSMCRVKHMTPYADDCTIPSGL